MLRCWMCEVEPMYVDADARRVAVAWLRGFEWMRMVLEVDGEALLLSPGWFGFERMRWCWGGRRGVFVLLG
mgnify:CR=1 FL=1